MNSKLTTKFLFIISLLCLQAFTSDAQIDNELINSQSIELIKSHYQSQFERGGTMPERGFKGEWSPYAFIYLYSIDYPNKEAFESKENFAEARKIWLEDNQFNTNTIMAQISLYNEEFTKDYRSGLFK